MSNKYKTMRAIREGGQVTRGHTIRHIMPYTVGSHSFDVASIILMLHPDPSVNLLRAALWHDVAERFTGDIPAPVKWENPEFSKELTKVEEKVLGKIGIPDVESCLTVEELSWLKGADRLELRMWCKDELSLGNSNVIGTLKMLELWMDRKKDEMPAEIVEAWYSHIEERLNEVI